MFYSDNEIYIMARGHGENLRYTRECCSRRRGGPRAEKEHRMHRAAAALIALFRF